MNANATEYTFKIRKGVTFSDGTPLDAAAVAKNYDRSEVINSQTVKFTFKKPSSGFL